MHGGRDGADWRKHHAPPKKEIGRR
jgi:hypothetical protein